MKTVLRLLLAVGLLVGAPLAAATPAQASERSRADEDDAQYGCYGRYYYTCGRPHHHWRREAWDRGYGYGRRWAPERYRTGARCNGEREWCERQSRRRWGR